jgi:hypothetical protein
MSFRVLLIIFLLLPAILTLSLTAYAQDGQKVLSEFGAKGFIETTVDDYNGV